MQIIVRDNNVEQALRALKKKLQREGVGRAWPGAQSGRGGTVQVETVSPGSGPLVTAQDGVLIDYEGRLANGKVFDSSAGKGPVPVLASQTIPGFSQALMRMQEGGRY